MRVTRPMNSFLLCVILVAPLVATPHKSEAKIIKMTPEQRVQEYCDEYYSNGLASDYIDMVRKYILEDGAKSLPSITQIISEFDPTNSKGKSRKKDARAFAAEGLLSQLDGRVIRLRSIPEGKTAIDSLRRLAQRMLTAHFDTADVTNSETSKKYRYEASQSELQYMEGLNFFDRSIQDTLRIRYKIKLSDTETLAFIEYLISQEPKYPSWSTRENYKDLSDRNEAAFPRGYWLLKNMEPFYQAYLRYKGG